MWHIYISGFALGLYAAAMPGPINLEVVRRSLSRGPRLGLAFGLGACTADVAFVLLSSLGALAIINALPLWGKGVMWMAGSVTLFCVGISALRAKPPVINEKSRKHMGADYTDPYFQVPHIPFVPLIRYYFIGLALTLSSPSTIMFWVFTSFTVASTKLTEGLGDNSHVPYLLAAGVGTACTLWVIGAVTVAGKFHRSMQPRTYVLVERGAGTALCGFACFALYQAIKILS